MSGDGPLKILVADDDRISQRPMGRILKRNGYDVCTADDGLQAASALCAEGGPRLALIDWMMPGLDGPSVCREVRKRQDGSYVYIMLLTSKQLNDVRKPMRVVSNPMLFGPDRILARYSHSGVTCHSQPAAAG